MDSIYPTLKRAEELANPGVEQTSQQNQSTGIVISRTDPNTVSDVAGEHPHSTLLPQQQTTPFSQLPEQRTEQQTLSVFQNVKEDCHNFSPKQKMPCVPEQRPQSNNEGQADFFTNLSNYIGGLVGFPNNSFNPNRNAVEPNIVENVIVPTTTTPLNSFKDECKEMQRQEELERIEEEKQYEEEQKKKAEERRKRMMGLKESNRKQEEEMEKRREETAREMEMEQDELKNRLQEEQKQKEIIRMQQIEAEKQKMDEENQRKEIEMEEKRAKLDSEIQNRNEIMAENQRLHNEKMEEKQRELLLEKARYEEYIAWIQKKYEDLKQESARIWEERMRKLNAQSEQLAQMMKLRVWNEIIENNWTNKLNFLRSANKEVARHIANLQRAVQSLGNAVQSQNPVDIQNQRAIVLVQVKTVIDAVQHEKKVMIKERETLETMFANTGKQFLCPIRDSVIRIAAKCEELKSSLERFMEQLDNQPGSSDGWNIFEVSERSYALSQCSSAIPTLAELKEQYKEQMNQQEDDGGIREDEPVFQTFIIEEVE